MQHASIIVKILTFLYISFIANKPIKIMNIKIVELTVSKVSKID